MTENSVFKVAVVGGGAAGFFAAIQLKEMAPGVQVDLLEKSGNYLAKVKISGGGRCNVTHACFDPAQLVNHYPRGKKELRGPFHHYQPRDVFDWFGRHGISLKTEPDGRVFPVSNSSQTIVDCFLNEAKNGGIHLLEKCGVEKIEPIADQWNVVLAEGLVRTYDAVIVATGSSPLFWKHLAEIGLKMVEPVPSLFTFQLDSDIISLTGLSVPEAVISVDQSKLQSEGPLLITHWGLSGPAVLRLSAWGARELAEKNYQFGIMVNWINRSQASVLDHLLHLRAKDPRKTVAAGPFPEIPRNLWKWILAFCGIPETSKWADLSNSLANALTAALVKCPFQVVGKSTFKEEFVTAGGVDLREIDFKTMEASRFPGLYFAGEVLDMDAVTGGFNFQAAWTTAFIAARSIAARSGAGDELSGWMP